MIYFNIIFINTLNTFLSTHKVSCLKRYYVHGNTDTIICLLTKNTLLEITGHLLHRNTQYIDDLKNK
jgi:hypothetical protein